MTCVFVRNASASNAQYSPTFIMNSAFVDRSTLVVVGSFSAIDAMMARGVAEPKRPAIGGHDEAGRALREDGDLCQGGED